jgi:uncharacterized protein with HEPN domain
MTNQNVPQLNYELLAVDAAGQTRIAEPAKLIYGLMYADDLFASPQPKLEKGNASITDNSLQVVVSSLDGVSGVSSAFRIHVTSEILEDIEPFRLKLLKHLKRLGFNNINVLTDDISIHLSMKIYPKINFIENYLRSYLIRFFMQKEGVNWFDRIVNKKSVKLAERRQSSDRIWSPLLDTDMMMIDFSDLGEIVYRSQYNVSQNMIERLMEMDSDELTKLKSELVKNYTKFFKQQFTDKNFEVLWKRVAEIRHRVAHNSILTSNDYKTTQDTVQTLYSIIKHAESHMSELAETAAPTTHAEVPKAPDTEMITETVSVPITTPFVVVDKIKLPAEDPKRTVKRRISVSSNPKEFEDEREPVTITQDQLFEYLEEAIVLFANRGRGFVGMKAFVDKLTSEGFEKIATIERINYLTTLGVLQVDEIQEPGLSYSTKTIKFGPKAKKVRGI